MLHKKTLIALAAAVALGCVPVATNALAAGGHPGGHGGGGGQVSAGHGAAAADKPLLDVAAADARWLAPPVADMRVATPAAVVLSSDPAAAAITAAADTTAAAARSTTAAPVMATAMVDAPAMAFPLSAP